ncbi:MAG TPA: FG-GAP-like repeat-containing protein [Candidatus Krumholzibacteria bacterium]|nr:FG-GAP-like repeat-containing protein [Candidatus Krumholzibacteria bacterium]
MKAIHATPALFALIALLLAVSATVAFGTASVSTDKENYQPGETVLISGEGWLPGETVALTVLVDETATVRLATQAMANESGAIGNEDFVVAPGDSNTVFRLLAEGQVSGLTADTYFADGYYVQWVTVSAQSPDPVLPGHSATFTVVVGGLRLKEGCLSQDTYLSVLHGPQPPMPEEPTFSFDPPVVRPGGADCTATATLTVALTPYMTGGTMQFVVQAMVSAKDYAQVTGNLHVTRDVTPPVPDVNPLPVLTGECAVSITTFPTATDAVWGMVVGTTGDPLAYTAQGTYTVHWMYMDKAKNTSFQDQTVIVRDTTPPVFASQAPNVTVDAGAGDCSAVVSFDCPAALDNCTSGVSFAPAVNYPGFVNSAHIATGDLDHDGDSDIVVGDIGALSPNSFGVLLNQGDGTFAPTVYWPTADTTNKPRIADLDRDGDLDVVFAGGGVNYNRIEIMFNNGDATFGPSVTYPADRPQDVLVADYDGDGDLDLAVAQSYASSLRVYFNQGNGTFVEGGTYPANVYGGYGETTDFDGDGDYDVVIGGEGTLAVMFNHGDGVFDPGVVYQMTGIFEHTRIGDFNLDGRDDIAVGYGEVAKVSIMINNGDGTFQPIVDYPCNGVMALPWPVDVDGDGDLDLVLADWTPGSMSILVGQGDGTFTGPFGMFPVGTSPHGICSADFDRDGHMDIATANYNSGDVSLLLNAGSGIPVTAVPASGSTFPVGTTSVTLKASDGVGNVATSSFNVIVRAYPGMTCGGSDVVVVPIDPATGTSPVTFTFSDVTSPGESSLEITGTGPPPPFGFRMGTPPMYFELATTAVFAGPVTVCIDYSAIAFGNEQKLRLWHQEDGHWVDRTASLDTDGNVICATVSSFSAFAVMEALPPAAISGTVSAVCEVTNAVRGVTVDVYNATTGSLVGSSVTNASGGYFVGDLEAGDYAVTIVTPLGYVTAADEVPVTVEGEDQGVDFVLSCVPITAKPRGIGFWKHEVAVATGDPGKGQIDASKLCGYLDIIDSHFNQNPVNPVAVYTPPASGQCADKLLAARDVLNLTGNADMTARAKQQLMSLLMNVASIRLYPTSVISEDGATSSQAITYCDNLIDDPAGDHELAKNIAEYVNNATMVPEGLIPTDIGDIPYSPASETLVLPAEYALLQNIPNPFNPTTEIQFDLPEPARVEISVYDVAGRRVARLLEQPLPAGRHSVTWNGRSAHGEAVASGVYFYRLRAGSFTSTRRMILLK